MLYNKINTFRPELFDQYVGQSNRDGSMGRHSRVDMARGFFIFLETLSRGHGIPTFEPEGNNVAAAPRHPQNTHKNLKNLDNERKTKSAKP